jgi:drug/metabolite transporter (DMT)-like permease
VSGRALAFVLAAALIHAGWNALAKRAHDPLVFLWSSVSLASLCLAPLGAWVILAEGWRPDGAAFVLATIIVHAVYFWVLGRAYASGDLSTVYPVARGLGVALVPILALVLLGERVSALGVLGVVLVVAGIVAIYALGAPRSIDSRPDHPGRSLDVPVRSDRGHLWGLLPRPPIWSIVTGLTIAAYSIIDKAGVARVHPLAYIALMGVGISVLLAPWVLIRRESLAREWRVNGRAIVLASSMNLTSYLLVLFAFRLAKVGYIVAARESSIVFSVLIGSLLMGEANFRPRLVGALVVLIGVACVALAP